MSLAEDTMQVFIDDLAEYLLDVYLDVTGQEKDQNVVTDDTVPFSRFIYYDSFIKARVGSDNSGISRDYGGIFSCHVAIDKDSSFLLSLDKNVSSLSNQGGAYTSEINSHGAITSVTGGVYCLNSFVGYPIRFRAPRELAKQDASGNSVYNFFKTDYSIIFQDGTEYYEKFNNTRSMYTPSKVSTYTVNNGDYSFSDIATLPNSGNDLNLPYYYDGLPVVYNVNSTSNSTTTIINDYYSNTWNTYNYTTNEGDTVNINYNSDNGIVDLSPLNGLNLSFDDLLDLFGVGIVPLINLDNDWDLDFPTLTDLLPQYPIVTGDINVNIDLPDVTWVENPTTIRSIESEVNYIMSDGFPELPSVTMDVDSSVAALNSGFTFFDGLGLLSPFILLAVIRLLISKFRGDS